MSAKHDNGQAEGGGQVFHRRIVTDKFGDGESGWCPSDTNIPSNHTNINFPLSCGFALMVWTNWDIARRILLRRSQVEVYSTPYVFLTDAFTGKSLSSFYLGW